MHPLFPALLYIGLGLAGLGYGFATGEPRTHLYMSLVPGLGFLAAGLVALSSRATSPRALRSTLTGAAFGLAATVIPWAWLAIHQATYSGGGANIGLAFLLIAMPFYVVPFIGLGWKVGGAWFDRSHAP